jgi:hypothetical protein
MSRNTIIVLIYNRHKFSDLVSPVNWKFIAYGEIQGRISHKANLDHGLGRSSRGGGGI